MYFDPLFFVFLVPGLLLGMYAQYRISSTYNRYIREGIASGVTGAEAARTILDRAGMHEVPVNMIRGHLTDHYDPMKKALFVSEENFNNRSIAAVGVAAHEAGHALQHGAGYAPMHIRMGLVPVTNLMVQAAMVAAPIAIFLFIPALLWVAVLGYAAAAFFQLVTLPVEYDASRRAKEQLINTGIVQRDEAPAVSKVLNAAALTYVAGLVTAVLTLLYWLHLARSNR
jgi:Zn-dependent membrane protease YugP